jgi:predicted ATPase/signal transduction histidine kinase
MGQSDAYVITEPLREEANVAIYHGLRVRDRQPVKIKVLGPMRRRPRDLERLKNEYEIASRLDIPTVVRPLAFDTCQGAPALIFEDFGGTSLDERHAGVPMELEPFLRLAIALAKAVGDIHALGVVHKDIKPHNILVHPDRGRVELIDFELASLLPCEQQATVGPRLIEGSLPYMSPEQTGRTSHAIDHRTDLYSLGVTLYELRAGRLPFDADDPLGWIHCHLARTAPTLALTAPGTPETVSKIVAKLLAKAPEDRYQSARGLQRDLEYCLERWVADGRIAPFALAQRDVTDRFQVPQRLYGRERESAALLAAFERVVAGGASGLALVSGYAGVGKTTLVQELYQPIVRQRAYLVAAKFELHARGIPYSALVQAWQGLLRELLSEAPDEVARWGRQFREALGINARLLIDVLPELELLMGPPPRVPLSSLDELERRFLMVARQFVDVIAGEQHPLVLFLDDLQWADAASLKLIEALLTADSRHLLIIGAYRDNEVPPAHPLHAMVEAVGHAGIPISHVCLGPLSAPHVLQLVADTVRSGLRETEPLAASIHETTAGNPLFVTQLLTSLHERQLLGLDRKSGSWRWDLDEINARGFTTNVVDLMVSRLCALPERTRQTLELAACGSNLFDPEVLAIICDRSEEETRRDLWEAVRAGVVVRADGIYRFVHDRVQEVAYSFIAADRRAKVHLEIGRRLLAHTSAERLPERVFDIVGQLNRSAALIDDRSERDRVAELNLLAGQRARAATAYASAVDLLATGMELLGDEGWQRQYELTYRLYLERAQCEYLNNALENAESLLTVLLARAQTRIEKAAIYAVAVQLHATKGEVNRSLTCTLECLHEFGIEIPVRPTRAQVEEEYRRVLATIEAKSIESLVDLPIMSDPETMALMAMLTVSTAPAFFIGFEIYASLVGLTVRLSLEHGNTDASAHVYAAFGAVAGVLFGRYQDAHRLGKAGLALVDKRSLVASRARATYVFAGFISLWTEPIEQSIAQIHEAVRASIETGNFTFASYAALTLIGFLLIKGDPLDEVEREVEQRLDATARARAQIVIKILEDNQFFLERLRGRSTEEPEERERRARPVPLVLFNHQLRMLQLHFLLGQYAEARAAADKAQAVAWSGYTLPHFADYVFYRALLLTQTGARDGLDDCERWLRRWAQSSPANFAARSLVVSAERARLDGRDLDAMRLFERAIETARARGCGYVEAIARELAAKLYRQLGFGEFARSYLQEARSAYARWGAEAKVQQLDREHPWLAAPRDRAPTTFVARASDLDLMSVLKASQRISGEIVLDELARTLVRVLLEQGGAQRGCLILARGAQLTVAALAELDANGVRVELRPEATLESVLPATIVQHAARTGERIIVEDASLDVGRFAGDSYLARCRPRSLLCLPIRRQAHPVGYLYLENALVAGAFTADRLAAAELLASQAAISLENAHLLDQSLAARTVAENALALAEAAQAQTALLAEAGALLAESLDYEHVLSRVAELVVRSLADWCEFDLIEDGQIRRRAGAHADPAKVPLLLELAERYPPDWRSAHPQVEILRSGVSLLLSDVSDDYLRGHAIDAAHVQLVRALGVCSLVVVPLKTPERILGALTLGSAATDHRYEPTDLPLVEELARRAAMAIDNARLYREARQAIHLREEFLSVASHELRTPLTSLNMRLQWLDEEWRQGSVANESIMRALDVTIRQGRRLNRQVEDLLDVSRIEAGRLWLERADVDLVTLVKDVLASFDIGIKRAGCEVTIDAPEPVCGRWDGARLEQVVSNLLTNALKFGAGRPIELSLRRAGERARLVVVDHGMGIDPAQRDRIFDRFTRAVPATHFGGLGLGLYICRELVHAHGGTIGVESRVGEGATFTVELPAV